MGKIAKRSHGDETMTDYDCFFIVQIRTQSSNGIDLEMERMDEMVKDIGNALVDKYPNLGVFAQGFEMVGE